MDISQLRRDYREQALDEHCLDPDPVAQFRAWFQQACHAELAEPNAMSLATTSAAGMPSLRTVLLKAYDERGFVFYTNYESAKAREMAENPNVALLFSWLDLSRQVIIRGSVEKISRAESMRYFASRPFGSQLGAWVSQQSSVISSRQMLELKWDEMKRKFREGKVPLPSFWGGYRVIPRFVEFWHGCPNRLHDRFLYTRLDDGAWKIERLAP